MEQLAKYWHVIAGAVAGACAMIWFFVRIIVLGPRSDILKTQDDHKHRMDNHADRIGKLEQKSIGRDEFNATIESLRVEMQRQGDRQADQLNSMNANLMAILTRIDK